MKILCFALLLNFDIITRSLCLSTFRLNGAFRAVHHVLDHLKTPPKQTYQTNVADIAKTKIPSFEDDVEIFAHIAIPSVLKDFPKEELPTLILIHEFFGLNPSIIEKAQGLSDSLHCRVVAPDTFRGESTSFIPKAIWLALTTPQERVNNDLDAVCQYLELSGGLGSNETDTSGARLAVMGFCYGGGKAIRYTIERRPDAATVVFYGSPVVDPDSLRALRAPVCGIYGGDDVQFPLPLLRSFMSALKKAEVEFDFKVYDGVGHAFWSSMDQIRNGDQPQTDAYNRCVHFLRRYYNGK